MMCNLTRKFPNILTNLSWEFKDEMSCSGIEIQLHKLPNERIYHYLGHLTTDHKKNKHRYLELL